MFTIVPGAEIRAGSDTRQCSIVLDPSQVAAVHASLKLESGQLWIRSEQGLAATHVNGTPAVPGSWMPVVHDSLVRIGRAEFSVNLQ